MSNKKKAYYEQPWWKGKTHIMDLQTPVEIGIEEVHDGKVEILSGLNEGDQIVAEGLKKVRPRGKIKPLKN